jgi:rfaE bifunctional protein nucleotidyltransferase chain/domain
MSEQAQQHSQVIRGLIEESARALGYSPESIAEKLAKHDRGTADHGDDLLALDTLAEILPEAHDLHNYLVVHRAQFGPYPDLEACFRMLAALEHRLRKLRPGVARVPHLIGESASTSQLDMVAERKVAAWRREGKRIVLTNGCFDLLHAGHVWLLRGAKSAVAQRCGGDSADLKLIVAINSDESVRALKGPSRPLNCEDDRCAVVSGVQGVDYAFIFRTERTTQIIRTLRPDFLVKSGEWASGLHPEESAACDEAKTQVVLLEPLEGYSTTGLMGRIAER